MTEPLRLLFLVADTGGGHRAAARAVVQTLHRDYPGVFEPVLCDPLGGPRSAGLLRRITGLYGPAIRMAPWMWGAVYHSCDSRPAVRVLRSTLLAPVNRPVADAVSRHQPAAIVSFHPLTGWAAARARDRQAPYAPVVTVVTDLVAVHTAWHGGDVDRIVVPPTAVRCLQRTDRLVEIGLPVAPSFATGPVGRYERAALRRRLGVRERGFLVLVTGGGDGAGGIARKVTAILRDVPGADVAVLCGRNGRLHRTLTAQTARFAGRLTVRGFVDNMADWLRVADVVVGKAGPGTIAEATCLGAPLVLTSHLPGQETGNTEYVVRAGAGRHAPTVRDLVRVIDELYRDPSAVDSMRAASARLGRPMAAADIAALLAGLVGVDPVFDDVDQTSPGAAKAVLASQW